ncbi:hypothetical protein [Ralstonia holmesii]|uniref:hypothetical protein n=1 Tax=Ralstonia holmesii TaxID=3058602 RepID=UPI003D653E43
MYVLQNLVGRIRRLSAMLHEDRVYWWALGDRNEVIEGGVQPGFMIAPVPVPQATVHIKGTPVAFCPVMRPGDKGKPALLRCYVARTSAGFEVGCFADDHIPKTIRTLSPEGVLGVELAGSRAGLCAFVTHSSPVPRVEIIHMDWEQFDSRVPLTFLHPPAFPSGAFGRVHGICTSDKPGELRFKLVIACKLTQDAAGWAELDANLIHGSHGWQLRDSAWETHATQDRYVMEPTLLWGADGAMQMMSASAIPTDHDIALRRLSLTRGWQRTDILRAEEARSLQQALPAVVYVPGGEPVVSGIGDNAVTEVDVQRWTLWPVGLGEDPAVVTQLQLDVQRVGKAKRHTLGTVEGAKQVLVGLIEGPPPVPKENLNLAAGMDKSSASAETTLSDQTSHTSTVEISASEAGIFEAKGEVGWIFTGSSSFTLNVAHTSGSKHTVTTTLTDAFKNSLKQEQKDGHTGVQPLGTAVVLGLSLTGYEFQFLDAAGKAIEDAPQMRMVIPHTPALRVRPYVINPQRSPVPGELVSYMLDASRMQRLQSQAMVLADERRKLSSSWGLTSTGQAIFQRVELDQFSRGFAIDLKLMLSVKANFLGEKGEIGGGMQLKLSGTWTSSDQNTRTLSTSVSVPGNRSAVGSYYAYSYDTYLLQPSQAIEAAFLESLVTTDWPADKNDRQINQELLDDLAPAGTDAEGPWMITYAVTESHRVQLLEDWLKAHEQQLDADLVLRLRASGATTTAEVADFMEQGRVAGAQVQQLL